MSWICCGCLGYVMGVLDKSWVSWICAVRLIGDGATLPDIWLCWI